MAKRKAARKTAARTTAARASGRTATKKTATRKASGNKRGATKTASRTAGRASTARKAAARKATTSRKTTSRKTASRKVTSRQATSRQATSRQAGARRTGATTGRTGSSTRGRGAASARTVPLRARRRPDEEALVPTPPSSLDLDRSASAVRSGRRALRERFDEHTETGPALTAGDVDANWESAYSVGDEAPGGDNPTPGQDIVDDIGRAVGVEYADNEELKGDAKIARRDKHRWELDPASSEDYNDR